MVRRRRGEAQGDAAVPTALENALPGAEPRINVQMSGTAEQVKRQLGVKTDDSDKEKKKPEGNGHDDEKTKFVESLRNSKFIIRVKRLTPREYKNVKTNVEVWSAELPLAYNEIQDEIKKDCGGGKYRVAIVDPNSNATICADVFEVDGDPIIEELQITPEEQDRIFMEGKPKTAADLTEDGLERRARVSAKLLEVESLEAQLEDARSRRKGAGRDAAHDDTRIEVLERRLTESKHQAELEARDRKHAEEMKELKASIAQLAQPKKEEGSSTVMMLLEQMREDRKAAQTQFTAILTQMKDDKLNAVLDEVKSIRNKPSTPANSLLDQAEAILKLKKVFGWGGDDEDEGEDEDDDRPWWEKALDKLGGTLGDKLVAKFTAMEEKGEVVDREAFMKDMSQYADQLAEEARQKAQRKNLPPPPPTLPSPPPPPRAGGPVPKTQISVLPPPPPTASPAPAAPAPAAGQGMTIEQEVVIRAGGVLEMIEREMELRPNEYHWNYEGAYLALPESLLEKVCQATDPITMVDAFAIPNISSEKLAEMKAKISGTPRIQAWLKMGLDDLKMWWAEKQKDPAFDPFADSPEEEVEE